VLRSSEVANLRWEFIDGDTLTVPRHLMKMKVRTDSAGNPVDHVVRLAPPVLEILDSLPRISPYVFPQSCNRKPLSPELIPHNYSRLGVNGLHTPHGWRSALRSLAADASDPDGRPLFAHSWLEGVLDHAPRGIEQHYVRSQHIRGTAAVWLWWAEQLLHYEREYRHDGRNC
jgi:integrase